MNQDEALERMQSWFDERLREVAVQDTGYLLAEAVGTFFRDPDLMDGLGTLSFRAAFLSVVRSSGLLDREGFAEVVDAERVLMARLGERIGNLGDGEVVGDRISQEEIVRMRLELARDEHGPN